MKRQDQVGVIYIAEEIQKREMRHLHENESVDFLASGSDPRYEQAVNYRC